jgi:endonuclease-3 related protein
MVKEIYERLFARYGDLKWWPADSPYEVIVGAVLTQNTNWNNVKKALAAFEGRLSPEFVLNCGHEELGKIIHPAGFFNQKAKYLKEITAWFGKYDFNADLAKKRDMGELRRELLAVKGIGAETADSILLYALELPSFVIDAYTMRFCERFPLDFGSLNYRNYNAAKAYFETNLPVDVKIFNNYHAMIVINGKNHCSKRPKCGGCPLENVCAYENIGAGTK